MSSFIMNTTDAVNNLNHNVNGVSIAGLMLTASIAMTYHAYGEERLEQADTAIRKALIVRFEKASEKGQPSDKARGYWRAGKAAFVTYSDKVKALVEDSDNVSSATGNIANWLETFALSKNHYEGGSYLMPLATGKSKKECRAFIAAKAEGKVSETEEGQEATSRKGNISARAGKAVMASIVVEEQEFNARQAMKGLVEYFKDKPTSDNVQLSQQVVEFFYSMQRVGALIADPEAIGHYNPTELKLAKLARLHIDAAPFGKFTDKGVKATEGESEAA